MEEEFFESLIDIDKELKIFHNKRDAIIKIASAEDVLLSDGELDALYEEIKNLTRLGPAFNYGHFSNMPATMKSNGIVFI
jgi:hypothetical protein